MSTLIVSTIQSSGGGGTAATLASINGGPISGDRNRIINGDMRIDQRNAGASVAINNSTAYPVDRWLASAECGVSNGAVTVQRVSDAPVGFTSSLQYTVTTARTTPIGAAYIAQTIEGQNISDFAYGTASAKTVTLSFYVKSSLTGTFSGSLRSLLGSSTLRSYVFNYTISSANTWQYVTVSVPGDTVSSFNIDNTQGLAVFFNLGSTTYETSTLNAWQSDNYVGSTSSISLISTLSATFYITGVQLEVGTVATPFERRSFGQELVLCQRYYQKSYSQSVAPGTNTSDGRHYFLLGVDTGTRNKGGAVRLSPTMRTTPSITIYNDAGTSGILDIGGTPTALLNNDAMFQLYVSTSVSEIAGHWTAAAEL